MPPPTDKSKGRSKKTTKNKRKKTTPKDKEKEKEKTITIPRLDQDATKGGGGMEKMPSNAPTMAIAPSDYEHIFHEGPVANANEGGKQRSSTPQPASPPPAPKAAQQPAQFGTDYNHSTNITGTNEIQVSPDGYTLLGQQPIDMSTGAAASRRTALPPHIVRANNQFSRAALARVAGYLASRAESYP